MVVRLSQYNSSIDVKTHAGMMRSIEYESPQKTKKTMAMIERPSDRATEWHFTNSL